MGRDESLPSVTRHRPLKRHSFVCYVRVHSEVVDMAFGNATWVSGLLLIACAGDPAAASDDGNAPESAERAMSGQCMLIPIPLSSSNCEPFAPRCAHTVWNSGEQKCYVDGLRAGCACYDGQVRSCNGSGGLCQTPTAGCGVQFCVVNGTGTSVTSDWETTCHTF